MNINSELDSGVFENDMFEHFGTTSLPDQVFPGLVEAESQNFETENQNIKKDDIINFEGHSRMNKYTGTKLLQELTTLEKSGINPEILREEERLLEQVNSLNSQENKSADRNANKNTKTESSINSNPDKLIQLFPELRNRITNEELKVNNDAPQNDQDLGKKFAFINSKVFMPGVGKYPLPNLELPELGHMQPDQSQSDKHDAFKNIIFQMQETNRTLHFPTCYNDLKNQSAYCNKPVVIVIAILLALICIASISGNFLVLLVIAKSSRLRKPPSVFKVSLAIADLLLSLFVIPSLLYNLFRNVLIPEDPVYTLANNVTSLNGINGIPDWIPRTVGSASLISMTASILTLLVMSVDRLVAIRWPIYHRIHNSCNRATGSIIIIWVISFIPTVIMNVSKNIEWHLEVHTMTFSPTFYNTIEEGIFNPLPLKSRVFGISYCLVYWVLPWILTTFLTVGVGFYGWKSLKSIKTVPKQRIRAKTSDTSNHTNHTHQTEDSTAKIIVPMHDESTNDSGVSGVSDTSLTSSNSMNRPLDSSNTYSGSSNNSNRKVISQSRKTENKNEDSSKRLVKTLTILVIMYTICTLPLTILQLYMWINDGSTIGGDSFRWLWFLASFLYLAQSAMNIFIYHRSKEFSEALKSLYGTKKTSIYNTSSSYRNTLRTNLASKVRVFKQATLSTSDGAQRSGISTITESININSSTSGNNYSRVFVDKGHIISKLNTQSTPVDRLAVYNIDIDDSDDQDYVSPPPRNQERFAPIMEKAAVPEINVRTKGQEDTASIASSGNGHSSGN